MKNLLVLLSFFLMMLSIGCKKRPKQPLHPLSTTIEPNDIKTHIQFLASDSLKGRTTGSPGEALAANYIADLFHQFSLSPFGDNETYFQQFQINAGRFIDSHQPDTAQPAGQKRLSRNVVGLVHGSQQPDSYLVVGAHYDHLGMGEYGSINNRRKHQIHNGADDNASGTAGVLELAQYFANNPPEQSIIFVTFSGEEIGLLGSQYFVEHPPVPLSRVKAMINLDMVGRLREDKLTIFGTGSSAKWDQLVAAANSDSMHITTAPDGTGASDHTSFYNKQVPVLHYFTDLHSDYHRPSDDPQFINYEGEDKVLEHTRRVLQELDTLGSDQLAFMEVPADKQHKNVMIKGVTLGVMPDYGFQGPGLRITGTDRDGPAEKAGLRAGDIITKLDGRSLKDIYEYMEILNTLEEDESSTVTVKRGEEELTYDIRF